jgi:arylsulfatase A-like enzyme
MTAPLRRALAASRPLAVGLAVAWLGACGSRGDQGSVGRGVLVIAIDGLRADHVHCYGYDRPTTPALDALAEQGVRFAQAFATAPSLLPSHASIVTGCDPNVSRRTQLLEEVEASVDERWRVPLEVPHLAVELLVHGFATAAFADHEHLSPAFGFAPGFQRYLVNDGGDFTPRSEMGLAAGSELLRQWLRSLERSKPWFAYLHAHDLERVWARPDPSWEGYFPPRQELNKVPPVGATEEVFFAVPRSRWRGGARTLGYYEALYDAHVRKLDGELDQLLRALRIEGRFENTTIIVVGTYGQQFGEAGLLLASGRYSIADVQVPWIMRSPRLPEANRGHVVETVASLLDVAPTLLGAMRLERPRGMHGVSQIPAFLGTAAEPPREFAFTSCGLQGGGAVFGERWTLEYSEAGARAGQASWYGDALDHSTDARDVFYDRVAMPYPPLYGDAGSPPPEVARALQSAGARWSFNMKRARRVLQGGTLRFDPRKDRVTVRELQELGYLGDDL